jgi:DNA-binding transcriptional LysR family regulator
MIARKIATTTQIVCAAPSYVACRGAPSSPEELRSHDCLRLARRHHLIDRWRFTKDGNDFAVHVAGTLSSGDGSVLRSWALSGVGISWEAYWDVADDITSGRLIELLPEYRCSVIELYAVFAPSKPVPPRIRLFVDYMLQMMRQFVKEDGKAAALHPETTEPE